MPSLAPASIVAALLALAGLVAGAGASAEAAMTPTVTINTIKGRTAPYKQSVEVKPSVTTKGNVAVSASTLTIKKGSKTVASNKKSAKLSAGTYRVTTRVTYRTWTLVTKTRTTDVTTVVLPAFTVVPAHCVVQTAVEQPEGGYALTLDCTSTAFDGTQTVTGQASGDAVAGWSLAAANSTDVPVTVAGEALVGLTFDSQIFFPADLTETTSVTTPYQERVYSSTKVKTKSQSLVIKLGARPSRTAPVSEYNCPSWAPIKGNAQSGIYHLPKQRFYKVTKPEVCFSTEAAAKKAGYRKSKV
jgi:hypothetical protein